MTPQPLLPALEQIREHLTTHDLPAAVSITVAGTVSGQAAAVQVTHVEDTEAVRNLLRWAWSLSVVSVKAWRPASSPHAIHLTAWGRTDTGLIIEVYVSVAHTPDGPGGDLKPGGRANLTVDDLRDFAGDAS